MEQLLTLLDACPRPVIVADEQGRVAYANPAHQELTGLRLEQVVGRAQAFVAAPSVSADGHELARLLTADGEGELVRVVRWAVPGGFEVMFGEPGLHPLTGPHLDEILVQASSGVLLTERTGRVLSAAGRWRDLLGVPADAQVTNLQHWLASQAIDRLDLADLHRLVEQASLRDDEEAVHLLDLGAGRTTEARVGTSRVHPEHVLVTVRDITTEKSREEDLEQAALTDPLTGLPNRSLGRDRLRHALDGLHRSTEMVAALFVDLDRFSQVNLELGHVLADEVLTEAARRVDEVVRPTDTVIRWGGDELVVVLEHVDGHEAATEVAERIRATLATPVELSTGGSVTISASIGVTLAAGPIPVDELISAADQAMYEAKADGGNGVHLADLGDRVEAQRFLTLTDRLRSAVRDDDLELWFQPIVDLANGRVIGAEALLRWRRGPDDLLAPQEFLPQARRSGLIGELSTWVLDRAGAAVARWEAQGHGLMVSVNLTPEELDDPQLVERAARALETHRVRPYRLAVEFPADVAERSPHRGHRLRELSDLGIRVALGDFGAAAPLDSIGRLVVDAVKIPARRVDQLDSGPSQPAILQSLIRMAGDLGLEVVAEGIERPAQAAILKRLRCPAGQGVLLGAPIPEDQLIDHLHVPQDVLAEISDRTVAVGW